MEAGDAAIPVGIPPALSRAERIHAQFSWTKRLARNARPETARLVIIQLFGVSDLVATLMG
ncbi:hypothetical protein KSD_82130 [Ktedonobacter sp. SOSP1-85]|uniref:hypothetical protein n=1 Tax=Ktedonobacter sp. SOSP1-85 TaxID=2778367 RepID=UPI001916B5D1|nr:hypothetical protein [Ktedonobacter sp. SOSP1-85]GHO80442.1 hypothetical protein KSD_82130 [Ktedonobacter sp. SOSP1-85]